jgi:hypothetical protein
LNTALKAIFERTRPIHDHGIVIADGWSFPSGHASGAVIVYGLLGYLVIRLMPRPWHLPVTILTVALVVFVGFSRAVLQVHYFSDVIAGYASAAAWCALSIGGLEAIRRARRPDLKPTPTASEPTFERKHYTLAGDLSAISVFDAIQVIENARLNGVLTLTGKGPEGRVKFNDGRIVDAACAGESGDKGFQKVVEITTGTFEFQKTVEQFPIRIEALSNTNLILDTLRMLDEQKQ